MFQEKFGNYEGLKSEDYKLLDQFLKENPKFQDVTFKKLIAFRHEENEMDPKLIVFQIMKNNQNQTYVLKIKRIIDGKDEFALQKKAYDICPQGVIKPYLGGTINYKNNPSFQFVYMDEGQDISQIAHQSKEEIIQLYIEFLRNLQRIREGGISHRDIKPMNLVYHDGHIKLIDFDFATSQVIHSKITQTNFQSGIFSAPEMLCSDHEGKIRFGATAMIFSVSMCLFLSLNHDLPPGFKTFSEYENQTQEQCYRYNTNSGSNKFTAPLIYIKDENLSNILAIARAHNEKNRYKTEETFARALEAYLGGKKPEPTIRLFVKNVARIFVALSIVTMIGAGGMYIGTKVHTPKDSMVEETASTQEKIISEEDHLAYLSTMHSREEIIDYCVRQKLAYKENYYLGERKSQAEVEIGDIQWEDGLYTISESIHLASDAKENSTYRITKDYFQNRNGNITMFGPFDLSVAGFPFDDLNYSEMETYLEPVSDNIVSWKAKVDFAKEELDLQSLSVRDQEKIIFKLYVKWKQEVIYETVINLEFDYT